MIKNIIILLILSAIGFFSGFYVGRETAPADYDMFAIVYYYACMTGAISNKGRVFAPCNDGARTILELRDNK